MASGLPVLASSTCGAADDLVIPEETGFLFHPYRTEELADCFARIAADPRSASKMGEKARHHVSAFSLSRYASQVAKHLGQSLADSGRHRRTPGICMDALS